jgi:hypothetical protein
MKLARMAKWHVHLLVGHGQILTKLVHFVGVKVKNAADLARLYCQAQKRSRADGMACLGATSGEH